MAQKIAIVTGGTRGIGASISKALVDEGHKVVAIYFGNNEAAEKAEKEMGVIAHKLDVSNFDACRQACNDIEEKVGPADILVNNAGITRDGVLHKMSAENWHDVIETNLTSCFNMCRVLVPGMRERGYGRIVNISSINGQKGQFGQTNYAAAKAGMIGFTKSLALEGAAKGITANVICPGYIETEMTGAMREDVLESIIRQIPNARMGKPEEIADMVAYLSSDKAAYINGATLSINGAQYMA